MNCFHPQKTVLIHSTNAAPFSASSKRPKEQSDKTSHFPQYYCRPTCSADDISAWYCLSLSSSLLQYSTVFPGLSWEVMKKKVPLVTTVPPRTVKKDRKYTKT